MTDEIIIAQPGVKNPGEALVLHYRDKFEQALGYELISGHLSFGNFLVAVAEDVAANPKLAQAVQASPASAISALLMAAQCKLLPGSKYEYVYLIPRMMSRQNAKGGWSKIPEVTCLIGYKGLMELSKRHPRVHKIDAHVVYRGEEFEYLPGESRIVHKWRSDIDRTPDNLVAAYARCTITEPQTSHAVLQDPILCVLSKEEVERSRERSEAWKSAEKSWDGKPPKKDSPWHTDTAAMWRKTALRAMLRGGSVPKDMGLGGVIAADDEQDRKADEIPPLPKPSQASSVREILGISSPKPDFATLEEALAAIDHAKSATDLRDLASRWQHFVGYDAEQVSMRYAQREDEIGGAS